MKETERGFIALFRQFVDWEWYDDANTMRVFIHCLLLANYKNKKWRGKTIKRGQFITSQPKLAHSLKLSVKQIRGSLEKLKRTGEVAVESNTEYSIITVKNYDLYQDKGRQMDTPKEEKGQSEGRQGATTNKDNNIDTNSYINISSSSSIELTKEEEELLKSHSKRNKIKYFKPWLRKILENGDYKELLEKERKLQAKEEEKKKQKDKTMEAIVIDDAEQKKIEEIQQQIKRRLRRWQQKLKLTKLKF